MANSDAALRAALLAAERTAIEAVLDQRAVMFHSYEWNITGRDYL